VTVVLDFSNVGAIMASRVIPQYIKVTDLKQRPSSEVTFVLIVIKFASLYEYGNFCTFFGRTLYRFLTWIK
jgi:hypothetical protein